MNPYITRAYKPTYTTRPTSLQAYEPTVRAYEVYEVYEVYELRAYATSYEPAYYEYFCVLVGGLLKL